MKSQNNTSSIIENILLGLLSRQPMHGYVLYKKIKNTQELSLIWQVKLSKLYYLLDKLETRGLLAPTFVQHESRPDRKQYHLTDIGQQVFLDWVQSPVTRAREMRIAFLARLYFVIQMGQDTAQRLIEAQDIECRRWIESLRSQLGEIENPDFISKQVFQYRIGQVQAMLDWIEDCKQKIIGESEG